MDILSDSRACEDHFVSQSVSENASSWPETCPDISSGFQENKTAENNKADFDHQLTD